VLDHLRANGVQIRTQGQLAPEQVADLHRWSAEGMSKAEIGRRLGITRQAVSLRLSRADASDTSSGVVPLGGPPETDLRCDQTYR